MEDEQTLQQMLDRIARTDVNDTGDLGSASRDLELLFERLSNRNDAFHRAFRDYWTLAEVIWVSHIEDKQPVAPKQTEELRKLLTKLRESTEMELQKKKL
jgi:hypothetical protein